MTHAWRVAERYHVWWKLALCLTLFTAWFDYIWVPRRLVPETARRVENPVRTDIPLVFETLAARIDPGAVVVVLVGDSTVGGWPVPAVTLLPALRHALAAQLPGRRVQLVNLTFIGLYVEDALLMIARALAAHPTLIIYAMSGRIAPTQAAPQYETAMRDLAFEWDVASRVGFGRALEIVGPHGFARTLAYSFWPVLPLRAELARAVRDGLVPLVSPNVVPAIDTLLVPPATPPARTRPVDLSAPYMWMRDEHRVSPPTASTEALDDLTTLCGRERRCLLYHIPIHPAAAYGFEPGLLDDFVEYVDRRAKAAGVSFEDYRTFGRPEHFTTRQLGGPDPIHRTPAGHTAFAPVLAARAVQVIAEQSR